MFIRRAILSAVLMMLLPTQVFCLDATMGRYDPQQTSYTAEKLEPPLALNWEFTSSKYDNNPASPIVADGVCYFGSGDRVYAVDIETGNMKWKYPIEQGLSGSVKGTPAVYDGRLYFGAGDGNLYCLDAETGIFNWAYQTRGSVRCPPVISDGILYFGSDDNSLYAIDASVGELAWPKQITARDDIAGGLALGNGMVVISCMDGNLYGINNSGKPRWKFMLPNAPTKTSPAMMDNIVVMAVGNTMSGFTIRSGQKKWTVQLSSEIAATPVIDGTDIYVPCHDRKIYAYTVVGRQPILKWALPIDFGALPMSSPIVADKLLYVTGSHGIVSAYSTVDGTLKWRYAISPSQITTLGQPYTDASSSPTVAEGTLLVLTDDGVLHCFTPTAPDNTPPDIYNPLPINGMAMSGVPPIKISAILYDVGSGVDFSSVTLALDEQPVEYKTDMGTGTVSYETPVAEPGKSAKSLPDGVHKIKLTAKDYFGNKLENEWFFIVDNTLPPPKSTTKSDIETGKKKKEPVRRNRRSNSSSVPPFPTPGGGGASAPPAPPPMPTPGNTDTTGDTGGDVPGGPPGF